MTTDPTAIPILVIRGEGHLGGHLELHLHEPDGTLRLLERPESPHGGGDLAMIAQAIAASGTTFQDVIVDLERVPWLNSTGLGWLVGLVRWGKEEGGMVALAGVNERIAKLLHATSLDIVLPCHPSVDVAARELRGERRGGP